MKSFFNQSIENHPKTLALAFSIFCLFCAIYYYQREITEAWMRFALRNEYIVVSLTTTPYRINKVNKVIDFVFAEQIPIQSVYLNVPHVFKRDNLPYVIPKWVEDYPKLQILRTEDYGPATKLLGTLERAQLPQNAIIITIDDDINYPKDLLLYLAYKARNNPNYAVGYSGMNPLYNKEGKIITDKPNGVGLISNKTNNAFVAILEGFAGIAYRKSFFNDEVFEILNAPRECRNSDDIYLSFFLARNNIKRQVLRKQAMNMEKITWNKEVGFNADALHQLSPTPAQRHHICVKFLKDNYPDVLF